MQIMKYFKFMEKNKKNQSHANYCAINSPYSKRSYIDKKCVEKDLTTYYTY